MVDPTGLVDSAYESRQAVLPRYRRLNITPRRQASGRSKSFLRFDLADLLPAMLVVALLIQSARAFDAILPSTSRVTYVIQFAIVGYYLFSAILDGHFRTSAACLLMFAYLVFELLVFRQNSGAPLNFNAIFGQFSSVTFVCFIESRASIVRVLRITLLASIAYAVIYLLSENYLLVNVPAPSAAIVGADASRSARVYLAPSFASFVAFYGLEDRRSNPLLRLALVGLGVAAIWASGSRFYFVTFAIIFLLAIVRLKDNGTRVTLYALFLLGSAILLSGVLVDNWNPYALLSRDDSGFARSREYTLAMSTISRHFLVGVGTPSSADDLAHFLQTARYEPFYASDLGVVGVMFQFGAVGLMLYVLGTGICILSGLKTFAPSELRALQLTCMTLGLVGVSAPYLFLSPETVFFALLVSALVRRAFAEQRWRAVADSAEVPA